jgi:hypothetical protein
MGEGGHAEARKRELAKCEKQRGCEGYTSETPHQHVERTAAPAPLSLLATDVQPYHRSPGFADDTIAIAAAAAFEPRFGREIASQDSKQDSKNNQAYDRKQHRIAKIHGPTVVRRHRLVKRPRPTARFRPMVRLRAGRGRPRRRILSVAVRFTGTSRPRRRPRPCSLTFLSATWILGIATSRIC